MGNCYFVLPSPEEQPHFSARVYRIGWIVTFAIPLFLIISIIVLIIKGSSAVIAIPFVPFIVGFPAIAVLCRRHGARLTNWDNEHIELESARGRETVLWDDIEWFWKLWLVHKLEGGGKVWIATLVRYRRVSGERNTVLLTVSGTASDAYVVEPISPRKYTTAFDVRIPSKLR